MPYKTHALHFGVSFAHCSKLKWPAIFMNAQPNFILLGHMTNQFQIIISGTDVCTYLYMYVCMYVCIYMFT